MPNRFHTARPNRARTRRYGQAHRQERRRLEPIVNRGDAYCQQGIPGNGSNGTCRYPTRWIRPGTPWALGHNDAGTAWIGPVHTLCNQRAAASAGAAAQRAIRQPTRRTTWHTTTW